MRSRLAIAIVLTASTLLASGRTPQPVRVVIHTEAGEIEAAIDTVNAPITAANFLKYVDAGFYDGGRFFRAVRMDNQPNDTTKIEVIQAAANPERRKEFFPAIPLERTSVTGLKHVDGSLSMARSGPDTARDSFSIVINDQPSMDFGGARNKDGQGFAVFGRVTSGMDVVRKTQSGNVEAQQLRPPVRILKVVRK